MNHRSTPPPVGRLLSCAGLLLALALTARAADPGAADFALFEKQFRELAIQVPPHSNEQLTLAAPSDQTIQADVAAQRPDGGWNDIDYANQDRNTWRAAVQLKRTLTLAKAYTRAKANGKTNAPLRQAVLAGLDYWTAKTFHNPNWWQNEIGVPMDIADIMLLMDGDLSPQ